jgi:hypothetical protein
LSSPVGPTSLRRLDASLRRQDHTTSPSASASFVLRAIRQLTGASQCASCPVHHALPCHGHARRCRVHRISSRVSDDRDTPLMWNETAVTIIDLNKKGTGIFFAMGLDSPNHTRSSPSGTFFFCATSSESAMDKKKSDPSGKSPASHHHRGNRCAWRARADHGFGAAPSAEARGLEAKP